MFCSQTIKAILDLTASNQFVFFITRLRKREQHLWWNCFLASIDNFLFCLEVGGGVLFQRAEQGEENTYLDKSNLAKFLRNCILRVLTVLCLALGSVALASKSSSSEKNK